MNATRTAPALLVLSSVVLSVSASYLLLRGSPEPARAAAGTVVAPVDLGPLEERLARLEQEVRERLDAPAAPAVREALSPADAATAGGEAADALRQRLAALERRLMEVESAPEVALSPAEQAESEEERRQRREDEIHAAQGTLNDPAATVEEKVAAHAALRRVADGYTPEMVADLVTIGTHDPKPEIRADVWRYFDGSTHLPGLVPHLRLALASDPDPRVRAEAAETLGNYADDAAVLAALRAAIESEDSSIVRRKLARVLAEWSALLVRDD